CTERSRRFGDSKSGTRVQRRTTAHRKTRDSRTGASYEPGLGLSGEEGGAGSLRVAGVARQGGQYQSRRHADVQAAPALRALASLPCLVPDRGGSALRRRDLSVGAERDRRVPVPAISIARTWAGGDPADHGAASARTLSRQRQSEQHQVGTTVPPARLSP